LKAWGWLVFALFFVFVFCGGGGFVIGVFLAVLRLLCFWVGLGSVLFLGLLIGF
jgi:hypothetical protein